MNNKDNKTRVGSGWDFSDDVPDNKDKSNMPRLSEEQHMLVVGIATGKYTPTEAHEKLNDLIDTTCAQRVREAVEKERERIKQATVGHWVDDWLARKDFEEALTQQDNY